MRTGHLCENHLKDLKEKNYDCKVREKNTQSEFNWQYSTKKLFDWKRKKVERTLIFIEKRKPNQIFETTTNGLIGIFWLESAAKTKIELLDIKQIKKELAMNVSQAEVSGWKRIDTTKKWLHTGMLGWVNDDWMCVPVYVLVLAFLCLSKCLAALCNEKISKRMVVFLFYIIYTDGWHSIVV